MCAKENCSYVKNICAGEEDNSKEYNSDVCKNVLIWGTGDTAKLLMQKGVYGKIIGYISSKPNTPIFNDKPVYAPDEIDVEYDIIIVAVIQESVNVIYDTAKKVNLPLSKMCFICLPDTEEVDAEDNFRKAQPFLSRINQAYLPKIKRKTSKTDNGAYPAFCRAAAMDTAIFENFRRDNVYTNVLEHVSFQLGQKYLDVITGKGRPEFTDADWNNFFQNDLYGNPQVFSYIIRGNRTECSPTTLRYIKVLQDILMLFDPQNLKSVAEIGVGYAGQCRLLTSYIETISEYALLDLPEVLQLDRRYLECFGSTEKIRFVDGTKKLDTDRKYDLVISNYAFSELLRSIQDVYLDSVILRSNAGYITWNRISFEELDGYSVDELLKKIPGSSVIPEEPASGPNCIIIWGQGK